jgi:hypothetical protein
LNKFRIIFFPLIYFSVRISMKQLEHHHKRFTELSSSNFTSKRKLTASTRNGITSMMIRVDFTPRALKIPTDPRTDSMTRITPERPSNTYNPELDN